MSGTTKQFVYYAHCMGIYNTPQEQRDVELLEKLGYVVHNPNNGSDQEGFKLYGMTYFNIMARDNQFDVVAFRANPDGSIPAGVAYEVADAMALDIPVFELPSGISRRTLTLDQTREYLREVGQR